MRTMIRGGLLGLFVVALLPGDAQALVGWLEKLSGPGPFVGLQMNIPFGCYGIEAPPIPGATAAAPRDQGAASETDRRTLWIDYDCLNALTGRRPVKLAIEVGHLWSTGNELPYAGVDARVKPQVNILLVIPSAAVTFGGGPESRFGSVLDVGAGVGALWVYGSQEFFDAFWKPAIQPLRIAFRPGALAGKGLAREFVEIAVNATIIGGEMTAADFGATGPFSESNELVWNCSVSFDVIKLLHRKDLVRR